MKLRTAVEFSIRGAVDILSILPLALSRAFPTSPSKWAFGSWRGKRYADNPRYLFEFVSDFRDDLEATWLTNSPRVRRDIRRNSRRAFLWWEPAGLAVAFRSGVWLFTHEPADISPIAGNNALRVDLTHGTPLKRIGLATKSGRVPQALGAISAFRRRHRPSASLICCASKEARRRYSIASPLPDEQIIATGYPRWAVYNRDLQGNEISPQLRGRIDEARSVVLFAPTHRGFGEKEYHYEQLPGFREFLEWAESANVLILHRRHLAGHSQEVDSPAWTEVDVLDCSDINDLLPMADYLITDYSSIMYDYCLFSDGGLFLAPDLEEYSSLDQGLFVNYSDEIPGPLLRDWDEVRLAIIGPGDAHGMRLRDFRACHGDHTDPSPSETVLAVIHEHLSEIHGSRAAAFVGE